MSQMIVKILSLFKGFYVIFIVKYYFTFAKFIIVVLVDYNVKLVYFLVLQIRIIFYYIS